MIDLLIHKQVPSMNVRERMHWRAQRREVSAWEILIRVAAGSLAQARVKMAVRIHAFRRQRCHDEANLIGGCKGLVDGLVRAGLLVDDSRTWATFTYAEDVASKSPNRLPCTRIIITPAEPANQETTP